MSMALRPALVWIGAAAVVSIAAWTIVANTRSGAGTAEAHPGSQPDADSPDAHPDGQPRTNPPAKPDSPPAEDPAFKAKVLPFIKKYCLECHSGEKAKGGLTLEGYTSEAHARKDRKNWLAVQHVLAAGEMPPKNKPQPTK